MIIDALFLLHLACAATPYLTTVVQHLKPIAA